jgi:hypothetical protein
LLCPLSALRSLALPIPVSGLNQRKPWKRIPMQKLKAEMLKAEIRRVEIKRP